MAEVSDIVLASTTEAKEELEFAVNAKRGEKFDPEKAKEEAEKAGAAKATETDSAKAAEKTATEDKSKTEDDGLPEGVKKRFGKLTREAREAQERVTQLEGQIAELNAKLTPAEKKGTEEDPEPKIDDFKGKPLEEYLEAKTKWLIRQEQKSASAKADEDAANAQARETFEAHQTRLGEARERYEDWDDVANSLKGPNAVPISRDAGLAIIELENGPDVMYHLAKHPDEAKKLVSMSPLHQIMEVGRISASLLSSAAKKSTSKAPTPITPVRGGTPPGAGKAPSEMNTDEYIAYREGQRRRN